MDTRSELLRGASRQELATVILVLCRKRLVPILEVERLLLDIRLDRSMRTMEDAARRLPSLSGEAWRLCQARWDRARAGHERALALRYPEQLRAALAPSAARRCRRCGCTDGDCQQCVERTGSPCHWVSEDLCSACADEAGPAGTLPAAALPAAGREVRP